MYTDDIISVSSERTARFDDTTGVDVEPDETTTERDDVPPSTAPDSPNRMAIFAAAVATLALVAAMAFVALRGGDVDPAADDAPDPTSVPSTVDVATSVPIPTVTSPDAAPVAPVIPAVPVVPARPTMTIPPVETAPPVVPPPIAPPVLPPVGTIPPVEPPAPSGVLAAQADYVLDPGVDAVSILLSNSGDLALAYEIGNDGDGFSADQPAGDIAAGESVDVWIELDLVADGDGPTPFEQIVQIDSDGGEAAVTISGQVEKPGFVIAEFEAVPLVDYRASLRFTNVGGLPVEIVGIDAPGLRTAPIPDQIAAGETFELDVAICEDGGQLPIIAPVPQPVPLPPMFIIGSWVELETLAEPDGEPTLARTDLQGTVAPFDPLDCSPTVVSPVGDIAFDLG